MPTIKAEDRGKNVNKIVIQAYSNKQISQAGATANSFTVPINPETISQKFEIKLEKNQAGGTEGNNEKYAGTAPEELKLEFFLDHTNTVEGYPYKDLKVTEQVKKLLETVYVIDPNTHKPNFLKIAWNKQDIFGVNQTAFDCQLKTLDIQYVLFNLEGEPLRAKVGALFSAYIEPKKSAKKSGKRSPDLTHVRTVNPGDQFWLMTQKIYNDPKPLLQVARANGLTSIRQIKPGDELFFPPYDRKEI